MAFEAVQIKIPGLKAAADLSSKQYYLVELTAADTVNVCNGVTDRPIGVLQNAPKSGEPAEVCALGVTKINRAECRRPDWHGRRRAGRRLRSWHGHDQVHRRHGHRRERRSRRLCHGHHQLLFSRPRRVADRGASHYGAAIPP